VSDVQSSKAGLQGVLQSQGLAGKTGQTTETSRVEIAGKTSLNGDEANAGLQAKGLAVNYSRTGASADTGPFSTFSLLA
jgi:hypothetical protein